MSPLIKNLLFALGLALIAWLGYTLFLKDPGDGVSASNNALVSEAVRDGQEFLTQLHQLRNVELSGAVFEDPRFKSLIDLRQDIVSEPEGRPNPFLPLPEEIAAKAKKLE